MSIETSPEIVLSDRYVIADHVEEGAAAFKAFGYEKESGRPVFMKARGEEEGNHHVLRTHNEAEQMESFHHPQAPRLYDAGEFGKYAYLVMEWMPASPTIQKRLARRPDYELAARLTLSAAEVLATLHEQGKVHRDVKGDNLGMRWGGRVALLDFELTTEEGQPSDPGKAEQTEDNDRITSIGDVVGTAGYMAPEQVAGGIVTRRSDIHALGVVMYELTYGRPAFQLSGTSNERIRQRAAQHINFWPAGHRAPNGLRLIIQKATQPNPDFRYKSMEAMAEEIERYLSGPKEEPGLSIVEAGVATESRADMPTERFSRYPVPMAA